MIFFVPIAFPIYSIKKLMKSSSICGYNINILYACPPFLATSSLVSSSAACNLLYQNNADAIIK